MVKDVVDRMVRIEHAERLRGTERTAALLSLLEDLSVRHSGTAREMILNLLKQASTPYMDRSSAVLGTFALDKGVDRAQRDAALELVMRSDPHAGALVAEQIARDPDEKRTMRGAAIVTVRESKQFDVFAGLLDALTRDPSRTWRRWAAAQAEHLPDEAASEILAVGLHDDDASVRSDAAQSAAALDRPDPRLRARIEELAAVERRWWRRAHLRRCVADMSRVSSD